MPHGRKGAKIPPTLTKSEGPKILNCLNCVSYFCLQRSQLGWVDGAETGDKSYIMNHTIEKLGRDTKARPHQIGQDETLGHSPLQKRGLRAKKAAAKISTAKSSNRIPNTRIIHKHVARRRHSRGRCSAPFEREGGREGRGTCPPSFPDSPRRLLEVAHYRRGT